MESTLLLDRILSTLENVVSGDKRKLGNAVEQLADDLKQAVAMHIIVSVDILSVSLPLSRMISQVKGLTQPALVQILSMLCSISPANYAIDWLFIQLHTHPNQQQLHLHALNSYIEIECYQPTLHIPKILVKLKSFLTERVNFEQIPDVILVLETISALFPMCFSVYFKEFVDLLLGWIFHSEMPRDVGKIICESFVKFQPFWVENDYFANKLLHRFVSQAIDCSKKMIDFPFDSEPIATFTKVLGCFVAVIKTYDNDSLQQNTALLGELFNCFPKVFVSCQDTLKVTSTMNETALQLFRIFGEQISQYYEVIVEFILQQLEESKFWKHSKELFEMNLELIKNQGNSVTLGAVAKLLATDSMFSYYRLHWDDRLNDIILLTYQELIKSCSFIGKSITALLLDELLELQSALSLMNPPSSSYEPSKDHTLESNQKSSFGRSTFNWKQIGTLFSFDVLLLSSPELSKHDGTSKIFGELINRFHPLNNKILARHDLIQYSIVVAIQYLYNGSSLMQQIPAITTQIHEIVSQILQHCKGRKILLLCLDWISILCKRQNLSGNQAGELIISLMSVALHLDHLVRLSVSIVLKMILQKYQNEIEATIFNILYPQAQICVTDDCEAVTANYIEIMGIIGIYNTTQYNENLMESQRNLMMNPVASAFKADYFKRFFAFLQQPQNFPISDDYLTQAANLCHVSQTVKQNLLSHSHFLSNPNSAMLFAQLFDCNTSLKWFWMVLECANLFISAHLRTHLGNPMQSLSALEKVLVYVAAVESSYHMNQKVKQSIDYTPQALQALLQFVDHLEKRIYIAIEGVLCFNSLPSGNRFFQDNKNVCVGWYSRMRQPAVVCSVVRACSTDIIFHTTKRLTDIASECQRGNTKFAAKLQLDAEFSFLHLCKALASIHESDALSGVITHFSNVFGHSEWPVKLFLPWAKGIQYQAAFLFESAAIEYIHVLKTCELSKTTKMFVIEQITECFVRSGDWTALRDFQTKNQLEMCSSMYNPSYLKALSYYDEQEYDNAADSIHKCFSLPQKLETLLSCADAKQRVDELLLSTMIQRVTNTETAETLRQNFAKQKITEIAQTALQMSSNIHESLPQEVALFSLSQLREEASVPTQFSLNAYLHDSSIANVLLRTETAVRPNQEPTLLVPCIKLARKQANFKLASRLCLRASPALSIDFECCRLLRKQKSPYHALVQASKVISKYSLINESNSALACSVFLTIAKWSRKDTSALLSDDKIGLVSELLKENAFASLLGSVHNEKLSDKSLLGIYLNELQGKCLYQALQADSTSSKAFLEFAHWCYLQGSISEHSQSQQNSTITQIAQILPNSSTQIATKVFTTLHDDLTAPELSITSQLGEIVSDLTPKQTKSLLSLQNKMANKVLNFFSQAIENYFLFLSVGSGGVHSHEDHNIIATLRLLKLLVKYGKSLQKLFAEQLEQTPTNSWRGITPQLFSRLGHPDPWIRLQVQQLISRIGMVHPHDIVYPVLVGEVDIQNDLVQQQQFQQISLILRGHFNMLYEQVYLLLNEFTRLTVLWPEIGVTVLQRISHEMQSRSRTMKEEYRRIDNTTTLSGAEKQVLMKEKYATIMKLFHIQLSNFKETISRAPETPFESWFQNKFLRRFEDALTGFISPSNYGEPENAWKPFERLCDEFARIFKTNLQLKEMSPQLATMSSSVICMPGLQSKMIHSDQLVTIQSFVPSFVVIPTKTKPKKLIMLGSDGKEYPYLLKGREDLHLDERIMQFLNVTNQIFQRVKQANTRNLTARTFAVIPIGRRSGLIQWVNGSVPLFQVHKQWQRRKQKNQQKLDPNAVIPRPVDRYNEKLHAELKKHGVKDFTMHGRKNWPLEVMKNVFSQMQSETPSDLLEKEFWCSSSCSEQWWAKTQSFTRSVAVMSMIGFILGLGDRHLDNILVDFASGEVVHIDYNICFERGLKLRIPELVPFRLTSIIEKAFGVSGIEGSFRIACCHVLKVLRAHKETLLTLLQAFVYDPLVDWTLDKEETQSRLHMELNTNLSLLASRAKSIHETLAELSPTGQKIKKLFLRFLPLVHLQYDRFIIQEEEDKIISSIDNIRAELNNPARNERSGTYKAKSNEIRSISSDLRSVRDNLKASICELKRCDESFDDTYRAVCSGLFLKNHEAISVECDRSDLISLALIDDPINVDTLEKERPDIVVSYRSVDQKMKNLLARRDKTLRDCFMHLNEYQTIVSPLFYSLYSSQTSVSRWRSNLNSLLLSINSCLKQASTNTGTFENTLHCSNETQINEYLYSERLEQRANRMRTEFQKMQCEIKELDAIYLELEYNNTIDTIIYPITPTVTKYEGTTLQASFLPWIARYANSTAEESSNTLTSNTSSPIATPFDIPLFNKLMEASGMLQQILAILVDHWTLQTSGMEPPPWANNWITSTSKFLGVLINSHEIFSSKTFPAISVLFFESPEFLEAEYTLQQIYNESKSLVNQLTRTRSQQTTKRKQISLLTCENDSCVIAHASYTNNNDFHTWEEQDEIDKLAERLNEIKIEQKTFQREISDLEATEQQIVSRLLELKSLVTLCLHDKSNAAILFCREVLNEFNEIEAFYGSIDSLLDESCGAGSSKIILQNIFLVEKTRALVELLRARKIQNSWEMMKTLSFQLLDFFQKLLQQLLVPSFDYITNLIVNGYGQIFSLPETWNEEIVRSTLVTVSDTSCNALIDEYLTNVNVLKKKKILQKKQEVLGSICKVLCAEQRKSLRNFACLHESLLGSNIDDIEDTGIIKPVFTSLQLSLEDLTTLQRELSLVNDDYLPLEHLFDELVSWERRDSDFHTRTHERISKRRELFEIQSEQVKSFIQFVENLILFENNRNISSEISSELQQQYEPLEQETRKKLKKLTKLKLELEQLDVQHSIEQSSETQQLQILTNLTTKHEEIKEKSKRKQKQIQNAFKSVKADYVIDLQRNFGKYMNQFNEIIPLVKSILKQMENISDEAIHVVSKNLHVKYRKLCNFAESYVQVFFGVLLVGDLEKLKEQQSRFDFSCAIVQKLLSADFDVLVGLMVDLCDQVIEVSDAANQQLTLWKEKEAEEEKNEQDFDQPLLQATNESFVQEGDKEQAKVQVQNVYAVNALKRIKAKLQGSVSTPIPSLGTPTIEGVNATRLSVHEQVDAVIQSATNIENLAVLYEGWTAWI